MPISTPSIPRWVPCGFGRESGCRLSVSSDVVGAGSAAQISANLMSVQGGGYEL
jgi:hypothetical protein